MSVDTPSRMRARQCSSLRGSRESRGFGWRREGGESLAQYRREDEHPAYCPREKLSQRFSCCEWGCCCACRKLIRPGESGGSRARRCVPWGGRIWSHAEAKEVPAGVDRGDGADGVGGAADPRMSRTIRASARRRCVARCAAGRRCGAPPGLAQEWVGAAVTSLNGLRGSPGSRTAVYAGQGAGRRAIGSASRHQSPSPCVDTTSGRIRNSSRGTPSTT